MSNGVRKKINYRWRKGNAITLFAGDCYELLRSLPDNSVDLVLTSPPYCIGKSYENETTAEEFAANHELILPEVVRVTKLGGSICWQVGYHVDNGDVTPLDYVIYGILKRHADVRLRNRIIWTFGHGLHPVTRFSGRHETLLWFTKGEEYIFNLNDVRIPQKYPGKKAYKGEKKGQYSGNPLGKNPSDVWDIPNIKAQHVEKSLHPCQFPIALAKRVITALSKEGALVLDPYAGAGTTGAASILLKRRFVGAEINSEFYDVAMGRIAASITGQLQYRPDPLDKPIYTPPPNTSLTTFPRNWGKAAGK